MGGQHEVIDWENEGMGQNVKTTSIDIPKKGRQRIK